jgi:hypothetical protein
MDSIRRAYWEDYVRRVAMGLAVAHIDMPTEICVNRAVELADKVEEAINIKFPDREAFRPGDPLAYEDRVRHQ